MAKKRADEAGGNPAEETPQPPTAVPTGEVAAPAPTSEQPKQVEVSPVVQQLHTRNFRIFELLAMRDGMLEQGEDTSAIDALLQQQTDAFSAAMKQIINDKQKDVVVVPKRKEARRKTTVDVLEEIRDKLDVSGPANQ